MNKFRKLLFCSLLLFLYIPAGSVPATPYPVTRIQPDGSELTVYLRGDEFFKYELTTDGYLIRRDKQGFYHYAEKGAKGVIRTTGIRVNPADKRTEAEKQFIRSAEINPSFTAENNKRRVQKAAIKRNDRRGTFPRTGSPKSIVILVNFLNVPFVTPNPNTAFTNMLNKEGYNENGGTGSARDYFIAASNGLSSPEFVVVGPYTLPNTRAYYGANDLTTDDDMRPQQMVIDACTAAAANGVNFAEYDTDNDGVVDNIFIFYAGHNEAEGGPDESVWPHRWEVDGNVTFNGKRIQGYACTSELRGNSGANMSGIGTFAHEFGHVYGLVDYYATNGEEHHTLWNWNIMDNDAYLNQGRTPPTYSAYDRFYLGWLVPEILRFPQHVFLEDLKISNKAYIITASGNHNLNGNNPNPVEFFTLENRQKTGWDAFLPNSGMLITRIYYNANAWENNSPNNNADAMGVDIIEADGVAGTFSLPGDPFPGSKNITEYSPVLRNGTDINRPLTNIKQENRIISFDFMGGGEGLIQFTSRENSMSVFGDSYGNIILDKGKNTDDNKMVYVYNATGQLLRQVESPSQIVSISSLDKNTLYILKAGRDAIKIRL